MIQPSPRERDATTAPHRILVVDDEPLTLRLVEVTLRRAGYEVFTALSGQDALSLIERRGLPHLAIVDILMPGIDGFEFCRKVHAYCDLPVIMLTAVHEKGAVIQGISECAEDYVTKPFNPGELVARVERVLRRFGDFSFPRGPVIDVDQRLAVDFPHQQAIVEGQSVGLTPTESKLLYVLMRNQRQTVTTDSLLRRLWPLKDVFQDALPVHVHRLRQKIEADPGQPRYIVTERDVGYRFAASP